MTEEDFEKVAEFFDRAVGITENIVKLTGENIIRCLYEFLFYHPCIMIIIIVIKIIINNVIIAIIIMIIINNVIIII